MEDISYRDREYHLYLDEGGIFGTNSIMLSDRKQRKNEHAGDITNYHFGKLSYWSILSTLRYYSKAYDEKIRVIRVLSEFVTKEQFIKDTK